MEINIIRSKWSRGLAEKTRLLDDDGKTDALGVYLRKIGLPDDLLLNQAELVDVYQKAEFASPLLEVAKLAMVQSELCSKIIACNDNPQISDDKREAKLCELFAELGFSISYED